MRRRKNLYEAQRALYLMIAAATVAALILLPLALYASASLFAIAAWSTLLVLAGLALTFVGALRRRWIASSGVLAWIESRSVLGGRLRTLVEIAERHGVSPHQVVVRWHVEHGFIVIPKSTDPGRIAANFDVFGFALDAVEVARIDAIGESR